MNIQDFVDRFRMIIDSNEGLHNYWYNFAAECKAEDDKQKLVDRIQEFTYELQDERIKGDDFLIRDILGIVFNNSDFRYSLANELWDDEYTNEILSEV